MKLILHIGTEKTGTSSIQKYLSENRNLLMQYGYYIPKSLGGENHRKVPGYCVRMDRFDEFHHMNFIKTIESKKSFKKSFEQDIENEFSNLQANIHTVIITSEHFHSRIAFQDEVDTVKKFFQKYFDEFRIIVYLRRQIDLVVSSYSTALKNGNYIPDITEFIKRRCRQENHYYNYEIFLSMWEHTFSKAALDVRLFDKEEFYLNDLIWDFTHTVSEDLQKIMQSSCKRSTIENESLTIFGQDVLNIVNNSNSLCVADIGHNDIYIKLRKTIMDVCHGKGKQPDYVTAGSAMARFLESNKKIQEKYFPNRISLFDESLEKFKKRQGVTPESELKVFEEIIKILNVAIMKKDVDTIRDVAVSL